MGILCNKPSCRGLYYPLIYLRIIINHHKDPGIKQPGFNGKYPAGFFDFFRGSADQTWVFISIKWGNSEFKSKCWRFN